MSAAHVVRDLPDAVAFIAGGTAGIGLATADALAASGVPHLVVMGRNADRGGRAVEELRSKHERLDAHFIKGDASVAEDVEAAFAFLDSTYGRVDVVVCSTSAMHPPQLLQEMTVAGTPSALLELALPPMLVTRAAYAVMKRNRGGCIINIASDSAKVPTPGEASMGAAMAAIGMFSRVAALEGKRDGIRVNVVTPSMVRDTEMTRMVRQSPFADKLARAAEERAHLGVPTAADVAALVVYLCGSSAARITGQAISVNGGISVA